MNTREYAALAAQTAALFTPQPTATAAPRGTFATITLPLAAKGIPCTPIRPNSKVAFLQNFPATATTDVTQLLAWDAQYPNHNAACVARAEVGGIWILEVDSPNVAERIKTEAGQDLNALQTLRVRSRAGRGHIYFRQTPASIEMGNLNQTYVKYNDFSARVNNMYCVAPGSLHPETGQPYKALNDLQPIEAPQWLIDWLISQKITASTSNSKPEPVRNERGLISQGSIHGFMLSNAGRLRNAGLNQDEIETALLRIVHEECEGPIDDVKVIAMAKSICNYPAGVPAGVVLTSGQAPAVLPAEVAAQFPPAVPPVDDVELPIIPTIPYPKFPDWVMQGTSVYEGLVKPICDANPSRIASFMFMPAVVMMLNYLGTKVSVKMKNLKPSLYTVLIGKKGQAKKSSCINDAMDYFEMAGVLGQGLTETKNADGRSLVWTAGSPEYLGIQMQKTNCKNGMLFYDELSTLANKAGIESSTLKQGLLTMYESGKFSNGVKSKKDSFSLVPGSYCFSLVAGTAPKDFPETWSRLASGAEGLDDRFTFILQPEVLPERAPFVNVSVAGNALRTRVLIDRAVDKREFAFFDQSPLQNALEWMSDRDEIRAEKYALFFAVDLGLDDIDEDCVERAIALVRYEKAVKRYLRTSDADSKTAAIQMKLRTTLERAGGRMGLRELERKMNAHRYDTFTWSNVYGGLKKAHIIREEGTGKPGDPLTVQTLRVMDDSDDD